MYASKSFLSGQGRVPPKQNSGYVGHFLWSQPRRVVKTQYFVQWCSVAQASGLAFCTISPVWSTEWSYVNLSSPIWKIPACFCLFWGHNQLCSGLTPGYMFSDHSWWAQGFGDIEYWGSTSGQPHKMQAPYPQYSPDGPRFPCFLSKSFPLWKQVFSS